LNIKKTYFISDVHLGAPAMNNNPEREKLFVDWLETAGKDAAAIYMLGDIFDFWYEYRKVVPRGFVRTLGKIAELSDKGIPIHFFTGNHDVWVFDYLPSETGVIIHREPIIEKIGNKKFFLGHGDGLDQKEKGYLALKRLFTSKTAQFMFSRLHPNLAIWFGHEWAKRSRISKGTEPEYITDINNESAFKFADNFSKSNNIDYYIFGHRHILHKEKLVSGAELIMLGEWFNFFSYAEFDGDSVEIKKHSKKLQ
jgi:UDP-2,3-diacylglucosamine hydrolase